MKILVFDTETTGLPERNASFYDTEKWPYIVQLSYILYDTESKMVLDICDNIIKIPNNITISKASENIHKISNDLSREKGIDINQALNQFNDTVINSDLIIGHNINFDKNMIIVETIRNKYKRIFNTGQKFYCTMKNSVNVCKIINPNLKSSTKISYKYPKLIELYRHYFNNESNEEKLNLHNSLFDTIITLQCYGMLEYNTDYVKESPNLNAIIGLSQLRFL